MAEDSIMHRAPSSTDGAKSINLAVAANKGEELGRPSDGQHGAMNYNFKPLTMRELGYLADKGATLVDVNDVKLYKERIDLARSCYNNALNLLRQEMPRGNWTENLPGLLFAANDIQRISACYFKDSNNIVFGVNYASKEEAQKSVSHEFGHAYLKNSGYDPKVGDLVKGESEKQFGLVLGRVLEESFTYYFEAFSSNLGRKPQSISQSEDILYNVVGNFVGNQKDAEEYAAALKQVYDCIRRDDLHGVINYDQKESANGRSEVVDEQRDMVEENSGKNLAALVLFAKGKNAEAALKTLSSSLEEVIGAIKSMRDEDFKELLADVERIPEKTRVAEDAIA